MPLAFLPVYQVMVSEFTSTNFSLEAPPIAPARFAMRVRNQPAYRTITGAHDVCALQT